MKEAESSAPVENDENIEIGESTNPQDEVLKPYDDIFQMFYQNLSGNIFEENEYKPDEIYTYTFDDTIMFKGSEALASQVLERGKNPGLGIGNLHKARYYWKIR